MWHMLEEKANNVFSKYGFKEIRTPIIEVTELFSRGVGDTTDIVNKEMYTFEKSDRSITLRPENTAGVVRSFIEMVCQDCQLLLSFGTTVQCLDMKDLKPDARDNSIRLGLKCLALNKLQQMLKLF